MLILLARRAALSIVRSDEFCPGWANVTKRNLLQRMRAALSAWLRELSRQHHDRYRPERHYMRGPGPKARGKSGAKTC